MLERERERATCVSLSWFCCCRFHCRGRRCGGYCRCRHGCGRCRGCCDRCCVIVVVVVVIVVVLLLSWSLLLPLRLLVLCWLTCYEVAFQTNPFCVHIHADTTLIHVQHVQKKNCAALGLTFFFLWIVHFKNIYFSFLKRPY